MLSALNPTSQAFVTSLDQISAQMSAAQQQLSTGLKVTEVSDAPDSISTLLQARANLAQNEQIQSNLTLVKTETDTGEQALESAVSLLQQAQTIGAQGATATTTADADQTLANQVGSIMQQMVALSQTTVSGRYIFSGNSDQTVPYTIDFTQTPPISAYAGGQGVRQVEDPNGSLFTIAENAQQIFDAPDPTQNVFSSLTALYTALQSGDSTAVTTSLSNLSTSSDYLNDQLAFYGNVQEQVADATSYAATQQTQLKTQISSLQDADITQSITELQQAQLQETAAVEAESNIPRTTLFDYLR